MEKNLLATRSLLRRLTLLELSEEASEEAARILAILEAKREPIEFRDVLIAAISKVYKSVLITRDSKHFMRIPDLEVQEAP
jgi:predicted nucleic acid-binding protein